MDWVDRSAWPWAGRQLDGGDGGQHVVDVGRGPTLLFVHGTPTWSFDWRHLIAGLSDRFRCVAVDHLGFGQSERPPGAGYRPEDHARRLATVVEALDLRDVTLFVHDLGGPIGLPLAFTPGRVGRLVLMNTFFWPLDGVTPWLAGTGLMRWAYRRLNFSVRGLAFTAWGDKRKLTPAIRGQVLAPWSDPDDRERVLFALARSLGGSSAFYNEGWAQRAALARLPALLVWGMKDHAFGPAYLARWRAELPDARVLALPGAGHWPHEEEPEAVLGAVSEFLGANPLSVSQAPPKP